MFDLAHIFIVFNAGSGGNFIAGVLDKLTRGDLTGLPVSNTGSSHTILTEKKRTGNDSISFGTVSDEHMEFHSQDDREQYYVNRIKEEYADVTVPQITWTHDFTNIPIYKKYFKNSRILTITHDTAESRLTSVCMHVTKVLLDSKMVMPIREPYISYQLDRWKLKCINEMSYVLESSMAEDIFNKQTTDDSAKDIIKYFGLRLSAINAGLFGTAEGIEVTEPLRFDYALYPNKDMNLPYSMGESNYDYIDSSDAVLSYFYLIKDEPSHLIDAIEKILQRELSDEEISFVLNEYTKYRQAQNKQLLEDPVTYYQATKEIARTHVKKIINDKLTLSL